MGILNTSKIEYVCYTSSSYSDMNYVRKRSHFSLFKFISKPTWNANGKMLVDCLIIFRRLSNASNGQTCKFAPLETLLGLAMCIVQYKNTLKHYCLRNPIIIKFQHIDSTYILVIWYKLCYICETIFRYSYSQIAFVLFFDHG